MIVGLVIGALVMLGFNVYNQYMMERCFKEQEAHWKAEIDKVFKAYK
jgi:hypothetical protein